MRSDRYRELLRDVKPFIAKHGTRARYAHSELRSVNARISPDIAAVLATHCTALGIGQADLVEALVRAYVADNGLSLERPLPQE